MKLVSEVGRFALRDNSMIFCNVVWICEENEIKMYHLIENHGTNEIDKDVEKYLVKD